MTSTTRTNYVFRSKLGDKVSAKGRNLEDAVRRATLKLRHRYRRRSLPIPQGNVWALELRFVIPAEERRRA